MASTPSARTRVLHLIDPEPDKLDPISVDVGDENELAPGVSLQDGVLHAENEDGSVTIDFDPSGINDEDEQEDKGFHSNLAHRIDSGKLDSIATSLLDGIQRDIDSRKEWLETRARGIQLLGLKLEEPRSDVGTSSAPLEGMSTVRHPLLLGATISFQAQARGELLPAHGPVKVRNDTPQKPAPPPAPQAAGPMPGPVNPTQEAEPNATEYGVPPTQPTDELAEALENDFNHYLTVTATEYVPDTDRMLFYIGFGGDGFKKVFNCPLRRRPVSESVDPEYLIVSNAATDLKNCARITHHIKMRKSILKRMQILGAYRDVELRQPSSNDGTNPVEQETQQITGINLATQKPEDMDYNVYECYCELELDEFAPPQFKGQGLPLPYIVTIERDSRQVLAIARNWKEDDEQCLARQFFVQFPFIRGIGFYGLGFVHVLGNTTTTLTAMWREMVDAGMFGNFPAFMYARSAGRQLTNQFRAPPGGGIPIDVPINQNIKDLIMPLPYKDVSGSFTAFAQWVEQNGMKLAQTADIAIGEGKQEAPVGTTLALIEQATKIIDSVHKRLHASQNEEFSLLKERFKEDPEAFWRHNRKPSMSWERRQFLDALDNYNLVPVADPNNPTSLHRAAKASVLEGLASKYPQLINQKSALERVFRVAGIDSEGLFHPQPLPPPPDPRMVAIQTKAQSSQEAVKTQAQTAMIRSQVQLAQLMDRAKDRESRERLEMMKLELERIKAQQEAIIHQKEMEGTAMAKLAELDADRARIVQEMEAEAASRGQELEINQIQSVQDMLRERQRHQDEMQRQDEKHRQAMLHQREMHEARMEHARNLASIKKKSHNKSED